MKTVRLFNSGKSQAVRIPAEYRFEGDEVVIRKVPGGGLLLLPKIITYEHLQAICGKGSNIERAPQLTQKRDYSCF